jgi:hypothetical protein
MISFGGVFAFAPHSLVLRIYLTPISQTSHVHRIPLCLQTDGAKLNDEQNLVWTRELAPGEKTTIDVSYTIEWPAGMTVNGIDV